MTNCVRSRAAEPDTHQDVTPRPAPKKVEAKLRGAEKVARIPVKIIPTEELPKSLTGFARAYSGIARGRPHQATAAQAQTAQRV